MVADLKLPSDIHDIYLAAVDFSAVSVALANLHGIARGDRNALRASDMEHLIKRIDEGLARFGLKVVPVEGEPLIDWTKAPEVDPITFMQDYFVAGAYRVADAAIAAEQPPFIGGRMDAFADPENGERP